MIQTKHPSSSPQEFAWYFKGIPGLEVRHFGHCPSGLEREISFKGTKAICAWRHQLKVTFEQSICAPRPHKVRQFSEKCVNSTTQIFTGSGFCDYTTFISLLLCHSKYLKHSSVYLDYSC